MMTVPCYIGPSPIAGTGIFAERDIKAGEKIWDHMEGFDLSVPVATVLTWPEHLRDYITKYGHLNDNDIKSIHMCSGHGKFFNHSETPNTHDVGNTCVASRDIKKGEEITGNYFTYHGNSNQFYDYENWRLNLQALAEANGLDASSLKAASSESKLAA